MPYIGHNPTQAGSFVLLDDIASGFDGSDVTFTLQIGGVDITPTADNLIIALDGVIQHSPEAYTVSGSTLTFTAAPASGVDFYGMLMGQSASIGQGAIGADELSVTGDGSANQMLVSDGDGTMTWKGSGLSATSATGDIIYRNSSGELARLAVGSAGQVLTVASGVPAWETDVESYLPLSGGTMSGALNMGSQAITNAGTITGTFSGNLTGNVTGNTSGTAATVTGASQSAITSVGTLAGLTVSKSSGWAAEFYQTAADQHGVGIHVGNNTSNNSAFEVQNSAESATYFKISQKGQISTTQTNGNLYGIEVYHSGANTSQPAHLIWGNNSGNTKAIVRIHENATRSDLATPVFEVLGTSSNTELFKLRADGNIYVSGQGTFYDNLNLIKSGSATLTIKGNASGANASLTLMEQTTTMWEIRGDGGSSDKLMFIDRGGADVLSLAQYSNATFGGWVYVNNRVMGASGDIRVGSNDGNEMLHLLAAGTAKIDTAGTTALSIDANQNVVIEDGSLTSKKSFYVTNTGPQMFLTDTDTSRYGSIYYGTRAFIFDNVMNNEALDSVNPWFEWRFATAESGTYTSMMKIERNAYTFNEAYSANFTNSGSNANMHVTAGNGSGRLYLDGSEWGELWFETSDSIKAGIKNNSSGDLILMSGGSTTALTLDSSQQATFSGNGKFGAHGGLENTMTGSRVEINGTWGDPAHGSSSNTKSILRVAGGGHSNTLDFGCNSSSPYNLWIQGTNRGTSGGNASTYGLHIQPKGGTLYLGSTDERIVAEGVGQTIMNTSSISIAGSSSWTTIKSLYGGYQSGLAVIHIYNGDNAAATRTMIVAYNADYYDRTVDVISNFGGAGAAAGLDYQIVRSDGSTTSDGGGPYILQAKPSNGSTATYVKCLILSAGHYSP